MNTETIRKQLAAEIKAAGFNPTLEAMELAKLARVWATRDELCRASGWLASDYRHNLRNLKRNVASGAFTRRGLAVFA